MSVEATDGHGGEAGGAERDALDRAVRLLGDRLGMRADTASRRRLDRSVRDRSRRLGLTPDLYAGRLAGDPTELAWLTELITVQETAFFRHPQHFEVLAEDVLPGTAGGVAWSAASSNGQEPWSLAMTLVESEAVGWTVLATDVSSDAVDRTRAGVYDERELTGLSPERRERFLQPTPDGRWRISDELRPLVRVEQHNLLDGPPPALVSCQIVLCCNVLIYLRNEVIERLLHQIRDRMPPDGWLFVGGAETLSPAPGIFRAERRRDAYVYRPIVPGTPGAAPGTSVAEGEGAPDGISAARSAVVRALRSSTELPGVVDTEAAAQGPQTQPVEAPQDMGGSRSEGGALTDADATAATRRGEQLSGEGRYDLAAVEFRRAAYLQPENPIAHLRLGLALAELGDPGATRALRAARMALAQLPAAEAESELDGWSVDELSSLLNRRIADG